MKSVKPIIIIIVAVLIAAAGITVMLLMNGKSSQHAENRDSVRTLLSDKQQIVIDCLGDSITWGMYSSPSLSEQIESGEIETGLDDGGQLFEDAGIYISGVFQSDPTYPEQMESELNRKLKADGLTGTITAVNDGISGDWITEDSWERISCDPDIVILLYGGNNYYFDYPIEGMFEKNLHALREQGIIVYLANYPLYPGEAHIEAFRSANEHIAKIAEKEQVPLIDFYTMVEDAVSAGTYSRKELFSPDHIHLSETGYELIGSFAADVLYEDIR